MAALAMAQQGVDDCDSDLFNRAVDVDAILGKASAHAVQALQKEVAAGRVEDSNIALAVTMLGGGDSTQMSMLVAFLTSEVKGFLASGINGGYLAGKPNGRGKGKGYLAAYLDKMPQGRREIVPGKLLSSENGSARVSATFVDPGAGRLPLVLQLEQQGGQWRVTEIVNAGDLIREAVRKNK